MYQGVPNEPHLSAHSRNVIHRFEPMEILPRSFRPGARNVIRKIVPGDVAGELLLLTVARISRVDVKH